MQHTPKHCHECGKRIAGRSDKRFCDDNCRSNFNNRLSSQVTREIRKVNTILRRNRRVIQLLLAKHNTARVTRRSLQEAGFNFKYHTHTRRYRGHESIWCYDFGYLLIESEYCTLLRERRP